MKKLTATLLLATTVAWTASAQNPAPAERPGADRNIDRPAERAPGGDRAMGDRRGGMMRPPTGVERIMSGGDVEGGMLLRLLDNPRIAEEINLTDDQRTKITEALKKYDAELEALRPKLEEAIKVQTGLLGELKPDEAKLMTAVEDAWKIRTEIAKIQTRKLLTLRAQLTVEQVGKAREMMENFQQRAGFRGRGDNGAPPADGERAQRPEGGAPQQGGRRDGEQRIRPEGARPAAGNGL